MLGKTSFIFAAAVGLFVVFAVALGFNLLRVRDSFAWVEHTNEVIRDISATQRSILETESGERGYLLTGDAIYLESYNAAQSRIPKLLDELARFIADNPEQAQRLEALRPVIEERLAEFRKAVQLGPGRDGELATILKDASSKQLTAKILEQMGQLRQIELALLTDRQDAADRVLVFATIFAAAISLLTLLAAAGGVFVLERRRGAARLLNAGEHLVRSQDALKSREADLSAILATVPDAMVIIDERGLIQSFSATAEQLFGFAQSEVQGRNVSMLMPEPYRHEHDGYLNRYLTTGERRIIGKVRTVVGRRKDGSTFPMQLYVGQMLVAGEQRFVGFVRDLTEREEREKERLALQAELLHVSRLSSMGQMASALAHELNQPLAAVSNYLQGSVRLLEGATDERVGKAKEAIAKASEQVLRAGRVIQRLREFVSRGETEKQIERISRLIEEANALALNVANDQAVRVTMQYDPAADLVLVDKIQIQQVLLNLIRNAIEAMGASTRRELVISTEATPDRMVAVAVADTGTGISADILPKLFEPFTTSKRQGMGVGLSISRTIIEAHGGQISAAVNPGGGTVFRFTLKAGESAESGDAK